MKLLRDVLKEAQEIQKGFETHRDHKQIEAVIETYYGLLNQAPEDPEVLFQLATAHLQLGHFGVGVPILKRVLAIWPDSVDAWSNLGCCYRSIHHMDEARAAFKKALGMQERTEILGNLAACYVNEGCPEEGITYAMRGIELDPKNLKAQWNLALLALEVEDWKTGFGLYDSGLHCVERSIRNYAKEELPWWDGQDGQTVVVFDEQGIGDRLMAAQLLPHFKDRINIILECHPRLVDIYRRSFPWIRHIYGTVKQEMIEWPLEHKIDARCAILSLAKHVWGQGIFDRKPYLLAAPHRTVPGRIGFAWAGGAPRTNTAYRSLKLGWFKELIEMGGEWVSFQYNDWAGEKVARMNEETGLDVRHFGDTENYDDTLTELATCELVITACNSVAHTCGAAGIPCWVLVPRKRAWRYPAGASSPFYSDALVQIHQTGDDWSGVMAELQGRLAVWLGERDARRDSRARAVTA